MALFGRKPKVIEVEGQSITLQPKPGRFGSPFARRGAPKQERPRLTEVQAAAERQVDQKDLKSNAFKHYVEKLAQKHKGLDAALMEQGIRSTVYQFVKRMVIASAALAVIVGATLIIVFMGMLPGAPAITPVLLGGIIGFATFYMALQNFLNFPTHRSKKAVKLIDRDIIFASRDLIISLRSGMPLFNALTSISTGYGEASKEFGKVVQKVQLGTPLVDAIDEVIESSKSPAFKRLMLQASVSIKSGADVVEALKSIIDELMQERSIELRKYGQRLNAVAMFYMLFGIIFPSMGIAVVTILTTFVALFTVDFTTLEAALVGIFFLQIVFLQLIRSSRPAFTM